MIVATLVASQRANIVQGQVSGVQLKIRNRIVFLVVVVVVVVVPVVVAKI